MKLFFSGSLYFRVGTVRGSRGSFELWYLTREGLAMKHVDYVFRGSFVEGKFTYRGTTCETFLIKAPDSVAQMLNFEH